MSAVVLRAPDAGKTTPTRQAGGETRNRSAAHRADRRRAHVEKGTPIMFADAVENEYLNLLLRNELEGCIRTVVAEHLGLAVDDLGRDVSLVDDLAVALVARGRRPIAGPRSSSASRTARTCRDVDVDRRTPAARTAALTANGTRETVPACRRRSG